MSKTSEHIDAHFDDTLLKLVTWCSQPSVSTENYGVSVMAKMAADSLRDSGFEVTIYPTEGYPLILAEAGPEEAPRLLIYNHYDVQPVGDPAEWTNPPFEPQ